MAYLRRIVLAPITSALLVACGAATEKTSSSIENLTSCAPTASCDGATGPELGPKRDFRHFTSKLTARLDEPNHRGHDQIYVAGEPQWVIGKFAYSKIDKDLEDEDVDVFVERGCEGSWEMLGTTRTGTDGERRAPVEGVEDGGGRVFFEIPQGKELAVGRHRVRLVVAGDDTSTDLVIDVVAKGTQIVVSDVDGTLTSSETAEFSALLTGKLPDAQPYAAEALGALARKGHRIVYITARPEWLTARTREFLDVRGFPAGILHTTTTLTGVNGDRAVEYKNEELRRLVERGLDIAWAFGNKATDAEVYAAAGVMPYDRRVLLDVDSSHGGREVASYAEVLSDINASPLACR